MIRTLLLLSAISFIPAWALGEEPKKPETPAQAIDAMIALLEKDDVKTLLLTRYGELDRFAKTDAEKAKIVDELSPKIGKLKETLLASFKQAKKSEPEITTTNEQKVAVYKLGEQTMRLYLKNGRWTFHL